MKNPIARMIQLAFCILAAVVLLPSAAQAGGWRDYNFPFPIVSREQAEELKPGAKIAMACTKCRTVQVREVDLNRGSLEWFTPDVKHVCPGCGGHWTWVTYGRAPRHGNWVHTCSKIENMRLPFFFICSETPNGFPPRDSWGKLSLKRSPSWSDGRLRQVFQGRLAIILP